MGACDRDGDMDAHPRGFWPDIVRICVVCSPGRARRSASDHSAFCIDRRREQWRQ